MLFDIIGLVGSVATGGGLSLVQHGLDMFGKARQAKQDKAHELAMLQLEIDARAAGVEADEQIAQRQAVAMVQSAVINADVAMHDKAMDADINETNQASQWVKDYKATTRPNILYALFLANILVVVWGMIDPVSFNQFVGATATKSGEINQVGHQFIMALHTGLLVGLGFYFGDRGMGKLRGKD